MGRSGPIASSGNRESGIGNRTERSLAPLGTGRERMTSTGAREVRAYPDLEALSAAAAESIVGLARESVGERGRFSIALAGGNTPKRTYRLLVGRHRDEIEWPSWRILFGDERFVPWDDDRSNFKMACDTLLADAPIPKDHVHPVPTRTPTAGGAADAYEQTLRRVL